MPNLRHDQICSEFKIKLTRAGEILDKDIQHILDKTFHCFQLYKFDHCSSQGESHSSWTDLESYNFENARSEGTLFATGFLLKRHLGSKFSSRHEMK